MAPPVVTSRGPACGSTPPRVGGIFEEAFSDAFLQAGFFVRPRKQKTCRKGRFSLRNKIFLLGSPVAKMTSGQIVATSHDRFGPRKDSFLE